MHGQVRLEMVMRVRIACKQKELNILYKEQISRKKKPSSSVRSCLLEHTGSNSQKKTH